MHPFSTMWLVAALLLASLSLIALVFGNAERVTSERFPPSMCVGDQPLMLNGAGLAMRLVRPLYEAGLYTLLPLYSAEGLSGLGGAKRLHAVALRKMDAAAFSTRLLQGVEQNNPAEAMRPHDAALLTLGALLSGRGHLQRGESFSFDYLPHQGTRLVINGEAHGPAIAGPAFFTLLLNAWIGPQPLDLALKAALLG